MSHERTDHPGPESPSGLDGGVSNPVHKVIAFLVGLVLALFPSALAGLFIWLLLLFACPLLIIFLIPSGGSHVDPFSWRTWSDEGTTFTIADKIETYKSYTAEVVKDFQGQAASPSVRFWEYLFGLIGLGVMGAAFKDIFPETHGSIRKLLENSSNKFRRRL